MSKTKPTTDYERYRDGQRFIGGTWYKPFSMERKDMGGRLSKKEAIEALKQAGIKVTTNGSYTPYVGHYALLVEADKADKADDILFG